MRAIITGVAGFVGSSLADALLADGHSVTGLDCFIPYYPRDLKDKNLQQARAHANFQFIEADINQVFGDPERAAAILDGVDVVFHQAAQAGVRASWGQDFSIYCDNNILATQKLLEACKNRPNLRVVYASSSSVYGETDKFPMEETDLPAPVSPYGVSKLAAEHLCLLYHANYGVHTVALRYFTVYGPRQRPDMAFHKLCRAALTGEEFVMYGTGEQSRDFTFIDDIVAGNLAAASSGRPGAVYNLGGGSQVTLNQVIAMVEELSGKRLNLKRLERHHGDVTHTGASTERARADLAFNPKVSLREGLARELEHIQTLVVPAAE